MKFEVDMRIGEVLTVIRTLHSSVVVKKELIID